MGEPVHRYYAEFEFPDKESFDAVLSSEAFAATAKDAMAMGHPVHRRVRRAGGQLAERRRALLAHRRDPLAHVGPRHVEELERERRVERRARRDAASC